MNRRNDSRNLFYTWQIGKCNNLSRLIVPPMYRSSELLQKRARVMNPIKNLSIYRCTDYLLRLRATRIKPIDGLEPPTYRLQGDCTAFVLHRLMNVLTNRSYQHTRLIRPPLPVFTVNAVHIQDYERYNLRSSWSESN